MQLLVHLRGRRAVTPPPSPKGVTIPILPIPIPMVLVLVLVLVLVFRHIFFKCPYSAKIIPPSKTLKKAYLTLPLPFLENTEETSFLELQMINITPHFHTKKALFSLDIAFQQSSIKGFRDRRIGTDRQNFEIMKNFVTFVTS